MNALSEDPPPLRILNIFALPHQTTVLFWLITAVLCGAATIGGFGSEPLYLSWLGWGVLILPLRGLLSYPERHIARHRLLFADAEEYAKLCHEIRIQAHAMGLHRVPYLYLIPATSEKNAHVFGSRKYWYIALPIANAQIYNATLKEPLLHEEQSRIRALLIHELSHFKIGDYWQMEYLEELFIFNVRFVFWLIAFVMGWLLLLLTGFREVQAFSPALFSTQLTYLVPDLVPLWSILIPPAEEWIALQTMTREFNFGLAFYFLVMALWPFIVINFFLWWLYYPRFWRAREYYADAAAVHQQQAIKPLLFRLLDSRSPNWLGILSQLPSQQIFDALARIDPDLKPGSLSTPSQKQGRGTQIARWLRDLRAELARMAKAWFTKAKRAWTKEDSVTRQKVPFLRRCWGVLKTMGFPRTMHPPDEKRVKALIAPFEIYESWRSTAWTAGVLALLLDVLLVSPLTLPFVADYPLHFPSLMLYAILAFALIPRIVTNGQAWRELWSMVKIVTIMRLLWLCFNLALIFGLWLWNPPYLDELFQILVAAVARYFSFGADLRIENLEAYLLNAAWINTVLVFIFGAVLFAALATFHWLFQRMLTWYRFKGGALAFQYACYILVAWMGLVWGGVILPIGTSLGLRLGEPWQPLTLWFVGVMVVVAAAGALWFIWADYRYRQPICSCTRPTPVPYTLMAQQCKCGRYFNEWLLVSLPDQ